jgi:hypothetical protein
MKNIEFQFQNGLIYQGFSDNGSFMGEDMVYVTAEVRSQMLRDLARGTGPRLVPGSATLSRKLSAAPVNSMDKLIALWGVRTVVLKDLKIVEYRMTAEAERRSSDRVAVLNGHYYDVVRHVSGEMEVGKPVCLGTSDTVAIYWGTCASMSEAMQRLNKMGVSDRTSKVRGELDADVREGSVLARRYKSPFRTAKDLCDVVSEVPVNVIQSKGDFAEHWARQELLNAQAREPDIDWNLGITSLMIEIERCRKRVEGAVEKAVEPQRVVSIQADRLS